MWVRVQQMGPGIAQEHLYSISYKWRTPSLLTRTNGTAAGPPPPRSRPPRRAPMSRPGEKSILSVWTASPPSLQHIHTSSVHTQIHIYIHIHVYIHTHSSGIGKEFRPRKISPHRSGKYLFLRGLDTFLRAFERSVGSNIPRQPWRLQYLI